MKSSTFTTFASFATLVAAQNVTVPTTCGNYTAGSDEVLYTVPYTYDQVISIIGNYSNLTWSGSPENSVTLNGTDDTVGTARTYSLSGTTIIETILNYSKPAAPGPYYEVHNTAKLTIAGDSLFIPYDGTTVTSVCDGKASMFNFTAHFCATNVSFSAATLHMLHLGDAVTVGKFLGGKNFTNCAALGASNSSGPMNQTGATTGTASGSTSGSPAAYTPGSGAGLSSQAGWWSAAVGVVGALLML
ncbi:hypothetical protein DOTSEDRAFT_75795 [Dothistroma septosporum NZE10]|uniref:Uncharacterized protein n=1 Tax=Dothistroma septosporum (strain NZE10 / CBS 128990) TaxID=675120 RepID=N1PD55_DOTSN|nr:hypothetical protein DOTSEDRAFT_75795 [Dothistroma septosporum NZE10]